MNITIIFNIISFRKKKKVSFVQSMSHVRIKIFFNSSFGRLIVGTEDGT